MFKILCYFVLGLLLFIERIDGVSLKINIFGEKNGKGLELDQQILSQELIELGCEVRCNWWEPVGDVTADVNIFLQNLNPSWYPYASQNWFIPNPEWYGHDLARLDGIDLILCRTREVERIFNRLGKSTYYLGFTSPDCYDPKITKHYNVFFHLAGSSEQKGTYSILNVWLKNPTYPLLIGIKHHYYLNSYAKNLYWISNNVETFILRQLQNTCGIHLCLSETEGFGHYLMEAMSTEAVVVTTDAPPMNEFVSDFLVPYQSTMQQLLGINYYVDQNALKNTIDTIIQTPTDQLRVIGKKNRQLYLERIQGFKKNLQEIILKAILQKKLPKQLEEMNAAVNKHCESPFFDVKQE